MADDVKVQISADISQMVAGMNQAASKLEEAVRNMTGNLEKLATSSKTAEKANEGLSGSIQNGIREYAAGAAAGLTIAHVIEKVGDFAKESAKWVYESSEAVNALAESFKELRVTTGENLGTLNELYAAEVMSGQGAGELQDLMMGWTRGVKANADALVANGVAADKAALQAMPFKEYLIKVFEISQEMRSPAEANVFLTEALGRSGAQAAPKLKELVENLKAGNEAMATGNLITQARIDAQERDEKATGRITLAVQKWRSDLGDSVNSVLGPLKEITAKFWEFKTGSDDVTAALQAGVIQADHWWDSYDKLNAKLKVTLEYFHQLAIAATEAAKDSMDVGAGDAARKTRSLQEPPEKPKKPKKEKEFVDTEVLSYNEMVEWSEKYLEKQRETQEKDAEAAAKFAEKLRQEKAEYLNEVSDLAVKAQQRLLSTQTIKGGLTEYLKQARQEMQAYGTAAQNAARGIEASFANSTKGMLTGQMSLSQGIASLWQGTRDAVIGQIAEMSAKWVTSKVMELVVGKSTAGSEAASMAALYANNAMASVSAIPVIGWSMAPAVGAAAYATGMANAALASAAGGWDRVPSDQLAMIHKNEMVLPARIAEGARKTFEGGGGGDHYHFHGVTDASWWRANQGNIARTLQEMRGNRRQS